jgi:regulatory protein
VAARSRSQGARPGGDRRGRRRAGARSDRIGERSERLDDLLRPPGLWRDERLDDEPAQSGGELAGPTGGQRGDQRRVLADGQRGDQRRALADGKPGDQRRALAEGQADDQADRASEPRVADPEAVARLICLRQLTAAPRTRAQLAETLRRRGVPDDAAEVVLGRFTEVGLIDDATFANAWVESRHHGRGLGRRALAAELSQRGVDRGDIDAAVAQLSQETELATARALVDRRLASTASLPAQARLRRLVGMLARKGYPAGLAYRVVREALERDRQSRTGEALDGGDIDEDEFTNAELASGDPD